MTMSAPPLAAVVSTAVTSGEVWLVTPSVFVCQDNSGLACEIARNCSPKSAVDGSALSATACTRTAEFGAPLYDRICATAALSSFASFTGSRPTATSGAPRPRSPYSESLVACAQKVVETRNAGQSGSTL